MDYADYEGAPGWSGVQLHPRLQESADSVAGDGKEPRAQTAEKTAKSSQGFGRCDFEKPGSSSQVHQPAYRVYSIVLCRVCGLMWPRCGPRPQKGSHDRVAGARDELRRGLISIRSTGLFEFGLFWILAPM